jgi:4-diphosphocytidyl-2-C-methyl-D-erythritol kinase
VSEASLGVRCPAKVNLVLRVLGRREDGYHELDTAFQAVDLWDVIRIRRADELSLVCDDPGLPVDESNLVHRAARMLCERHGGGGGRLELHKVIPSQAGLGGGSSDAAATLLLCNRFWELELAPTTLRGLARELGADVPFFLTGGTARGRGRGDRIEPLPYPGEVPVVLGCPPFGVSTAEVFRRFESRLTLPEIGVSVPLLLPHKWPEGKDFGFLGNDLESVVFEDWPELKGFRDALLEAGAGAALLSGSGSTVYGVFAGPTEADQAAKRVRERFTDWRVVTTHFVRDGIRWEHAGGA